MEEDQKKGKAGEGSKKGTKEKDRMRRRREIGEWKTGEEEKGWKEFREKRKEERKKRGGRRRIKTERAVQEMHRSLRVHSLARS